MATAAATYNVRASILGDGVSVAYAKDAAIRFDSSPEQGPSLPGPADLLSVAFAACVLKNVERMGVLLPFRYHDAAIEVTAERQDRGSCAHRQPADQKPEPREYDAFEQRTRKLLTVPRRTW